MTGIALDGRVELAWQPVSGADHYSVYRGTSPGAITTLVTPAGGVTGTSFADTTAANGTAYYYAARAIASGTESVSSGSILSTPAPRACSAGNPVVLENCYAGTNSWTLGATPPVSGGGIEGFGTSQSINQGESINLKVNTAAGVSYGAYVYRSGYYGGSGARLYETIPALTGTAQPSCSSAASTTGLYDCSNWSVSATITTTSSWPSGVYIVRLQRNDNGSENEILFVVRDDGRHSDLLYGVPFATYEAYNNYGGKSLYTFNSTGVTTVAGTARAVKVSFDRPFEQARTAATSFNDWYTRSDFRAVTWLERSGYDVAYQSGTDMELNGQRVRDHKAYMLGAHDEYYSPAMRTALEQARDNGVDLFNLGANSIYWKIRYENGPTGGQNRVEVCYKSIESGGPDPSGTATTTWRDTSGPNKPENALLGVMYVGDNSTSYFPLTVSASQGTDRVFRYTSLQSQPAGGSTNIGTSLIGWEWDSRVVNGFEPTGVKTLAATAVNGNLIQGGGSSYTTGPATVNATKYTAPSGALVFSTGTNQWDRGLALNAEGVGEPDVRIQQTTTNVLEDMGVVPLTPASNIRLDDPADPTVSSFTPGDGQINVPVTSTVTATFSTAMNAATITGATFTVKRSDGSAVAGSVAYDSVTRTATFTPSASLANGVTLTASLSTAVAAATGRTLSAPMTWIFTTIPPPTTIRINTGGGAYTAASGAQFVADTYFSGGATYASTHAITGTPDQALYKDERWGAFNYAIPVTPGYQYDVKLHFVELYYGTVVSGSCVNKRRFSVDLTDTPTSPDISNIDICGAVGANAALVRTINNVQVDDGFLNIQAIYGALDDPEIAAIEVVPSGSGGPPSPPTVTSTVPASGATGVSTNAPVTATFSRAMDGSTITTTSFSLKKADGTAVSASVGYDGPSQTATLTPTAALATSTSYTATITTAVKAADGTALANAANWSFTTAAPGTPAAVRINAGGPAYTASNGNTFLADQYFTGGSTNSTTGAIAGTTDQALYKDERWGAFSYRIPVVNGTYDVKLHFAEIYYGSVVPGSCVAKRVFSMDVGDTPANPDVPNLDICLAAGGPNTAYVRTV